MSNIDESGASLADTDINSTEPEGTNPPDGDSAAARGSGDDADRGNADGSNAVSEPRDRSLDQAGGNGSFDDASQQANGAESDAVDAGQDNGLNE